MSGTRPEGTPAPLPTPGAQTGAHLLLVLFGLGMALLLVGLLEISLRLLSPRPVAPGAIAMHERAVQTGRPCALRRGLQDFLPGEHPPRIAVIGESSGYFIGRQMEAMERPPGAPTWVTVNCAVEASTLENVAAQLEQVSGSGAEAVVLVFGHNLQMEVSVGWRALTMEWLSLHLRLFARPVVPVRADAAYAEERLRKFERLLRDAAARSRREGFCLVLTTVTPNYWLPAAPSADELEALYPLRFQRRDGARDEALRRLLALADARGSAALDFEAARWLDEDGHPDGARERLERALRRQIGRATSDANELIRRVAQEEHVLLRDTLRVREAAAPSGIPGWETDIDNCHLYPAYFAEEAWAILATLGHTAGSAPPAPTDRLPQVHRAITAHLRGHGVGSLNPDLLDDALALAYATLLRSDEAAFGQLGPLLREPAGAGAVPDPVADARVHRAAAIALWSAHRPDDAHRWIDRAIAEAPGPQAALAWVQAGLFALDEHRRPEAARCFASALAADPGCAAARAYHALLPAP